MPRRLDTALLLCFAYALAAVAQKPSCAPALRQPMTLEGSAPVITLNLLRADGTPRPTRFLFDSGGGAIILDQSVAADLGMKATGPVIVDGQSRFAPMGPLKAQFGTSPISLATSKAFIHLGAQSFNTRDASRAFCPARLWNGMTSSLIIQVGSSRSPSPTA